MSLKLKIVSANIRAQRRKGGISLPNLAAKAGIAKGNLSKIENEASNLSLDTLFKLAGALKVNPKLLLP